MTIESGQVATVKKLASAIAGVVLALGCSGCPALMIPGLAYSGYQYMQKKDQPQPQTRKSAKPGPQAPDTSIE